MVRLTDIAAAPAAQLRFRTRWWGSLGCRVALFMAGALFLVVALVGAFLYWEGKKVLDAEIQEHLLYLARHVADRTVDDLLAGNNAEVSRAILSMPPTPDGSLSDSDLTYLLVYNSRGELIAGKTQTGQITPAISRPSRTTATAASARIPVDPLLRAEALRTREPFFQTTSAGVHDLLFPVLDGTHQAGFIRLGMAGLWYGEKVSSLVKHGIVALLVIVVLGLVFSQLIAASITRPIQRLSAAVEDLGSQNWKNPIPVRGHDEVSRLGHAFNRLALTLKERDASLSRANRDLFILHAAGLDLMESLEIDVLLPKIAARATDLVQADTTALAAVDRSGKALHYLGVFGSKTAALGELSPLLEAGGIYNWIASYGTPLLILDAQSDFRMDREMMDQVGIQSLMAVPLWSSNTMIGLLTSINKKGGVAFDKHDLRLFTVFSNLVSAALQNALLYGDLKKSMGKLEDAQEQLIHSTKMAAIGELSANVAHEINNPLTSVLGYTTHLLKTLDLPEEPRRLLTIMQQETLRVRKIIRNLLDFARQRPAWMRPADIQDPLRETIALVQGMAGASAVRIHEAYDDRPLTVSMDSNEIKQVFINIVTNALHAMPHGGDLTIRATVVDQTREAVIEFADTGHGIPEENRAKIFEPFFSTKTERGGTGLGLSISYRIVQNHGGRIEVESESGKGSLFRIRLPIHQHTAANTGGAASAGVTGYAESG